MQWQKRRDLAIEASRLAYATAIKLGHSEALAERLRDSTFGFIIDWIEKDLLYHPRERHR